MADVRTQLENLQLAVNSFQTFPLIGGSTDMRSILVNGLDSLYTALGDGKVPDNAPKSGILDYYASILKDTAWLKARGSTSAPEYGFSNIDAVKQNANNIVAQFIDKQTDWMRNAVTYYNRAQSSEDRERAFLIAQSVVAAIATVGSMGFGLSNFWALKVQRAKNPPENTNFPALAWLWDAFRQQFSVHYY